MKFTSPPVFVLLLLVSSQGSAQEAPATSEVGLQEPGAALPAAPVPVPEAAPVPVAAPVPEAASALQEAPAKVLPAESVPIRPVLSHFAHHEGLHRYGQGALGVAGSGVLIGAGFAVEPHDRTWASVLWITGGVVALGSIASLLLPSELEKLQRDAANLSDEELRARWAELARARFYERRAGAVVGALFGATSIVLGGLVMDGEIGDLEDDTRRWVGLGLITTGAMSVVEGGVNWFVPSPIELGFDVAQSRPGLGVALAPTPTGVSLAVAGEF